MTHKCQFGSCRISNPSEMLWLSLLPARMKKVQSKMKGSRVVTTLFIDFSDAQGQLTPKSVMQSCQNSNSSREVKIVDEEKDIIKSKFSIVHYNIQSSANKVERIGGELHDFDVICLTETWLDMCTRNDDLTLLSSLFARQWAGLQTLWRFRLIDLSIDEMVGAWCFGCCQTWWFTCWISFAPIFSFMYCWVLIFALSPFLSWFICSRRRCIDKLGVFHANQTPVCFDPRLN